MSTLFLNSVVSLVIAPTMPARVPAITMSGKGLNKITGSHRNAPSLPADRPGDQKVSKRVQNHGRFGAV